MTGPGTSLTSQDVRLEHLLHHCDSIICLVDIEALEAIKRLRGDARATDGD